MLDDGETLTVSDDDLRPTYEALWKLADEPGAISTAALLMDAMRIHPLARRTVRLAGPQSAALRKAVTQDLPTTADGVPGVIGERQPRPLDV